MHGCQLPSQECMLEDVGSICIKPVYIYIYIQWIFECLIQSRFHSMFIYKSWLVVWNNFIFPQPDWGWWSNLTFIFFRGVETTNQNLCLPGIRPAPPSLRSNVFHASSQVGVCWRWRAGSREAKIAACRVSLLGEQQMAMLPSMYSYYICIIVFYSIYSWYLSYLIVTNSWLSHL